jgi:tetratricopeptide (TPR) repeat protein
MAAPHDPTPTVAPADPAVTNSVSDSKSVDGAKANQAVGPTLPPTNTIRYILGDLIASGGMGVVYQATDAVLGREFAVKVLQDKFGPASGAARRFADEARIAAQLQHPAIPPIHDLGTLPDGRPFLAMKLIKGDTLEALLKKRPDATQDRGRFVAAFELVCQALAFAHARNVIHRDLKPANVMVGNFGEVQVMDWGLAKVLGTRTESLEDPEATRAETEIQSVRDSDAAFTQAGSILGTPAFMPPEQAIGAIDQIDKRSDVFGLGGILCAILTGRAPFVADTAESTRQAAARGQVTEAFARLDACDADPELVALCERCLAPEKADRPANAGELAGTVAELRAAADERARRAELERVRLDGERAAAEARFSERVKQRRLTIAAAVMLAAAVVSGLSAVLLVQWRANATLAAANDELTRSRAAVQARYDLALDAVKSIHTGESEEIALRDDRFKEQRDRRLKSAADFYRKLGAQLGRETDVASRRALAQSNFELAELTRKVGRPADALAAHQAVLAAREALAAEPGADPGVRVDIGRSLIEVATVLKSMGKIDEALAAYRRSESVLTGLAASDSGARAALAACRTQIGLLLFDEDHDAEALAAMRLARADQEALAAANWRKRST